MKEIEKESKCWGCGKTQAGCDCDDGFKQNSLKPPKAVLPFCGGTTVNIKAPWNDPEKYDEVMSRPCCVCGEEWLSTYHERKYGACPSCGAHGADG
jgi:hypothetical protein